METNPLKGLFGAYSPRPVEQRAAPQHTEFYENIYFEIPSGMIEKLLANPYTGHGTLHPEDYLSLQVCPRMLSRRRSSHYL